MNPLKKERVVVALLFATQFTHVLDFVILMPLGPQLMRLFSISATQFSLLVSAYTFSAAIAGLTGALFLDRFEKKNALLFLYAGFLFGTGLCALAPTYGLLLLARITAGAFGGLMGGAIFSLVADAVPEIRRGRATGTIMSAFALSSILGVPAGLWIANTLHWRATFGAIAALGVVVLSSVAVLLPSFPSASAPSPLRLTPAGLLSPFVQLARPPAHRLALLVTTTLVLGAFSVIPFISPFLVKNLGVAEGTLPLLYLVGGSVTFFTSRAIGRLSDRLGKRRVFEVVACLSLIPLVVLTQFSSTLSSTESIFILFATFMVFISGRFVPAMAMVTSAASPAARSGFMSLHAAVQQMASGVASLLAGRMLTTAADGTLLGFSRVGYFAVAMTGLAVLVARHLDQALPVPTNSEKASSPAPKPSIRGK